MKVALIYRGPIRPAMDKFLNNRSALLNRLDENKIEYESFLFSWIDENTKEVFDKGYFDNFFLLKEDNSCFDEYFESIITVKENKFDKYFEQKELGQDDKWEDKDKMKNILISNIKMFSQMKIIIKFFENYFKKYDFIILSRPDVFINIQNIKDWFKKDYYVIPEESRTCVRSPFIYPILNEKGQEDLKGFSDQFGIGTLESFKKVWDFGNNIEVFNYYLSQTRNEGILNYIAKKNNAKVMAIEAKNYLLVRK